MADASVVADMTAMLQCDARTARYYLSLSNNVQQAAVGLYFERGAAPPPSSFENETSSQKKKAHEVPKTLPNGQPLPPPPPAEVLAVINTVTESLTLPSADTEVFKDECTFGFDTPEAPGGLFLNLLTLRSVGAEFLDLDAAKTGAKIYLHQKWVKVPKKKEAQEAQEAAAVAETDQGGGEGDAPPPGETDSSGATTSGGAKMEPTTVSEHLTKLLQEATNFDIEITNSLYSTITKEVYAYPFDGILPKLYNICETILSTTDKGTEEAVKLMEEEKTESKYAKDLVQETGVTVNPDPTSWVCKEDGLRENLWLNLSDGHIGSGRQYFDGSGGKNGAKNHYEELLKQGKNYPLVVKLGTITKDGADVFSYAADEDRGVIDPYLATHLANIGINIMNCEKTEKTAAEIEYERNLKHNWNSVLNKNGKELPAVRGPGAVGLENLGNSCYMNSVLQAVFTLPEVRQDFAGESAQRIFSTSSAEAPQKELDVNLAKIGYAMFRPDAADAVRPLAFKNYIGKGQRHPLFSTGQQQDAAEFLAHVLSVVSRAQARAQTRPDAKTNKPFRDFSELFTYQIERRTQCGQSGKVQYRLENEQAVGMNVPMENAAVKPVEDTSVEEVATKKMRIEEKPEAAPAAPDIIAEDKPDEDTTKPVVLEAAQPMSDEATKTVSTKAVDKTTYIVPFGDCLASLMAPSALNDWMSPVTGKRGSCTRTWGFKTLPKYLLWKVNRFYVDSSWTSQKRNVEVAMPLDLDVANLVSKGVQPSEEEFSNEDAQASAATVLVPDEDMIEAITNMGFSRNAAIRACQATSNGGVEAGANWVMMHMSDPDLNDPVPDESGSGEKADGPPEQLVSFVTGMGIPEHHAKKALQACNNDVERAVDWAFSHPIQAEVAGSPTGVAGDSSEGGDNKSKTTAQPATKGTQGGADAPLSTKYRLKAIVTHLGPNSNSGHYVCHLRSKATGNKWLYFNDAKVTEADELPLKIGYMYLYEQC